MLMEIESSLNLDALMNSIIGEPLEKFNNISKPHNIVWELKDEIDLVEHYFGDEIDINNFRVFAVPDCEVKKSYCSIDVRLHILDIKDINLINTNEVQCKVVSDLYQIKYF